MSWTAQLLAVNGEVTVRYADPSLENNDEARAQFVAASELAGKLIDTGVVGENKNYVINVSGHANPDHEPAEGFANDTVTIQVYQQ
jgi:hypothetical protein